MEKNNRFWVVFFLLLSVLLSSCNGTEAFKTHTVTPEPTKSQPTITPQASAEPTVDQTLSGPPQSTDGYTWWNGAIFYEIFVRSFYDSNGDGIGDFNGIIEKLDYLNDGDPTSTTDLGITGIWLMPINPSPSYHGYDVTDYYDVNPDYGTLVDFKNLLKECHNRGIHVIIDLVLNHTSILHPWFIEARDQPDSTRHDWYIWSETNPGFLGPWGEQVWYQSSAGYYYAIFAPTMPDLNYRNDDVTDEMYKVTRFWLQDVGVDGFRLDAARHLIELDQTQADTQITHQWWKNFRTYYKGINPQALTVGEVWTNNYAVIDYVQGDEFDMVFNFDLASQTIRAISSWNSSSLAVNLQNSYDKFSRGTYATFLTNHDQNRSMSTFLGDQGKAKLAASVLLTAPGTPFIYYGEEIGMTGTKPDENIRTPMLWSTDEYAGFSSRFPWESVNGNYEEFNVETETADPNSLLSFYRTLIKLRNEHSALNVGDYFGVRSDNRSLLSFLRVSKEETILVLINISRKPVSGFILSLKQGPLIGSYGAYSIFGEGVLNSMTSNNNGGFDDYRPMTEISANGLFIIQLR